NLGWLDAHRISVDRSAPSPRRIRRTAFTRRRSRGTPERLHRRSFRDVQLPGPAFLRTIRLSNLCRTSQFSARPHVLLPAKNAVAHTRCPTNLRPCLRPYPKRPEI